MNKSGKDGPAPVSVLVILDQKGCKMQLDTGATVSILLKALYVQHFVKWPLHSTNDHGQKLLRHGNYHHIFPSCEFSSSPLVVASPSPFFNFAKQINISEVIGNIVAYHLAYHCPLWQLMDEYANSKQTFASLVRVFVQN